MSNTIAVPATFHHCDKLLEMNNMKTTLARGLRFFNSWLFGHLVYAKCNLSTWLSGKAEHHDQESLSRVELLTQWWSGARVSLREKVQK